MSPTYRDFLSEDEQRPGMLLFGGARMALLDIEAGFWGLRRQMEALVGPRLTDAMLQQSGANGGASFAQAFVPELSPQNGAQALRDCIAAYQAAGFGFFEVQALEWPIGRVLIRAENTFEAWMMRQHGQKAESPVCAYTAGVLVGFVNALAGRHDVVCIERACQAQGDASCLFELLPAAAAGDIPVVAIAPDPTLGRQLNLLEMLFDRMPMVIAIFDRDYRLRRCNPTWVSFATRYTPATASQVVPGVSYFDLLPGTEHTVRPLFEQVLAGNTIRQEAVRLETNGMVSYWDVVLAPLIENGEVVGILDVGIDATERVQAEEELRKHRDHLEEMVGQRTAELTNVNAQLQQQIAERGRAEEELEAEHNFISAVIDTVGSLVVVLDRQGQIVRFNRACEKTTGYSFQEVRHSLLWDLLLIPEEVDAIQSVFEQLQVGKFPSKGENHWVTKDGRQRLIAWSNTALLNAEGSVEYVIGTGIDITERKQAEEALRKSYDELELRVQARTAQLQRANQSLQEQIVERTSAEEALRESQTNLRSLLENATNFAVYRVAIDTSDPHGGKVVMVSPSIKDIVGMSDPYRFECWFENIHPEDLSRAVEANRRAWNLGETYDEAVRVYNPHKKRWVWVHTISTPIFDAKGKLTHFNGLVLDITEQKQAEEALQDQIAFDDIITTISTSFINLAPDEIDDGIDHALQTIGEFADVDRSYVSLFSSDRTTIDNTHEWCAEGIEPQIQRMKDVPVSALAWSNAKLMRGEVLHIPRVADLPPEASTEKRKYQSQAIKSLISVPMIYRGSVLGFLGFDSVRAEKTWPEESIKLLTIVGEIIVNALEHKRAQAIQDGQRQFLELLATGGGFSETLHALIRIIEEQWPGMLGLILLLDEDGKHLHHGAAVSLPEEYTQSIEGLEIGPMVGSCGTASYSGKRVIVEDIAIDPRWDGLRDLGLKYGLRACWSEPVISSGGKVIGTFAMYYLHPRAPTEAELRTIEMAAHLVGIAVEHKRAQDKLREREAQYRGIFESTSDALLIFDLDGVIVEANPAACRMYGYPYEELIGLPGKDLVHPDYYHLFEDFKRQVKAGGPFSAQTVDLRKDGSPINIEVHGASFSYVGKPHLLAVARDITERVLARQTLERRVEERTHEIERRRQVAEGLRDIVRVLNSSKPVGEILDYIVAQAGSLLSTAAAIYRLDGDSQLLTIQASQGLPSDYAAGMAIPVSQGVVGRAVQERQPVAIPDLTAAFSKIDEMLLEPQQRVLVERLTGHYRAALAVPLVVKSETYGGIAFYFAEAREFSDEEIELAVMFADQATLAIENARLRTQAEQSAVAAERSRLARDLHDAVTQTLFSASLIAEVLPRLWERDSDEGQRRLEELRQLTRGALAEMRTLLLELRPSALADTPLADLLRQLGESITGRARVPVTVEVEGECSLPPEVKVALYRIAQEALNNVAKHSGATQTSVRLRCQSDRAALHISDDGRGFGPQSISPDSLGLGIMRERAEAISATLEIESEPDCGTQVVVMWSDTQ